MTDKQRERILAAGLDPKVFETRNPKEPTQLDRIEAQIMWTALITDTLLDMEDITDV